MKAWIFLWKKHISKMDQDGVNRQASVDDSAPAGGQLDIILSCDSENSQDNREAPTMINESDGLVKEEIQRIVSSSFLNENNETQMSLNSSMNIASSTLIDSPVVSTVLGSHGLLATSLNLNVGDTIDNSTINFIGSNATNYPATFLKIYYDPSSNNLTSSDLLYECKWINCNKKFVQQDALVSHVNDRHIKSEKDVEYICWWEGCARKGKGFNARYKMLIHVRTHTNEKPHQCSVCHKSFSRLENLKIHNRSHTGEKPYVCPVVGCNKAYSNSSDRFKHTRTHYVDKPYICKKEDCNKKYTDPSSLRKHMKTYGHYTGESSIKNDIYKKKTVKLCNNNSVLTSEHILHSLQNQTIKLHDQELSISSLTSNPMLSSTIVSSSSTQTISTQTDKSSSIQTILLESPGKSTQSPVEVAKCQTSPLDLSTAMTEDESSNASEDINSDFSAKGDLADVD